MSFGWENFTPRQQEIIVNHKDKNIPKYFFGYFANNGILEIWTKIYKLWENLKISFQEKDKIGIWILDENWENWKLVIIKIEKWEIFEEITTDWKLIILKNDITETSLNLWNFKKFNNFKLEWNKIIYTWEWVKKVEEKEGKKGKNENRNDEKTIKEKITDAFLKPMTESKKQEYFEEEEKFNSDIEYKEALEKLLWKLAEWKIYKYDLEVLKDFLDLFSDNKELLDKLKKVLLEWLPKMKELEEYILGSKNYKEIIKKMYNFFEEKSMEDFWASFNIFFIIMMVANSFQIIEEDISLTINNSYLKKFAEKWLLTENNINTLFDNLEKVKSKEELKKYDILFYSEINKDFIKGRNIDKIKNFIKEENFLSKEDKKLFLDNLNKWTEAPFSFGNEF